MMEVFRQIQGLADYLRDALEASDAFAGVPIRRGFPIDFPPEVAWVSYGTDGERHLLASNLTSFHVEPHLGGGISVTQSIGEDWTPIADRLFELTDAFEAVLAANKTLGGLCGDAWLSRTQTVETIPDDTKGCLTALFELSVTLYA